jgi:putative transposase
MKKSKFTEAQILFALKQPETGVTVTEVCRKTGISEATFYNCVSLPDIRPFKSY